MSSGPMRLLPSFLSIPIPMDGTAADNAPEQSAPLTAEEWSTADQRQLLGCACCLCSLGLSWIPYWRFYSDMRAKYSSTDSDNTNSNNNNTKTTIRPIAAAACAPVTVLALQLSESEAPLLMGQEEHLGAPLLALAEDGSCNSVMISSSSHMRPAKDTKDHEVELKLQHTQATLVELGPQDTLELGKISKSLPTSEDTLLGTTKAPAGSIDGVISMTQPPNNAAGHASQHSEAAAHGKSARTVISLSDDEAEDVLL